MKKNLILQKIRKKRMKVLFVLSFTIIPVTHFIVFYAYVNFNSFMMAFQKPSGGRLIFAGFENFAWVWEKIKNGSVNPTDNLQLAFVNTFKTFGINMIMFAVGLFTAYFIYKKIWNYKIFRIIFYLPTIISPVVVSFFYLELMSSSSFMPNLLERISNIDYNLHSPLTDSTFANKMVLLQVIWFSIPSNLIVWGGTLSRIPDSVIESAKLDGANWLRELFQIIIPLIGTTFVLMLVTSLAGIFAASGSVFLLTGGEYGTQTVSNWMYVRVLQTNNPLTSNYLYQVSAMGLILTIIACTIALVIRKFLTGRIGEVQY